MKVFQTERVRTLTLLASAMMLCGCGGQTVPNYVSSLVKVTGTVTLDGKPTEGIEVVFVPDQRMGSKIENAGGNATAVTDSAGQYTLVTPPGGGVSMKDMDLFTGAMPGKYAATFHYWVLPDGKPWATAGSTATQGPALMGAVEKLPPQLGSPLGSKYIVDVKAGSDVVQNFDLKSK
jgi:hypothetical protein